MIIGTGGKVIKQIQEDTQTVVAVDEDGSVAISGADLALVQRAKDIIEGMTREVKAGEIFDGTVEELAPYGAFVEILPGKTGLLHISEVSNEFVSNIEDVLKVGQQIQVKVLEVSRDGKYSLSVKALSPDYQPTERAARGGDRDGRNDRGDHGGRGGRGGNNRGGFDRNGGRGGNGSRDRGGRGGNNRGGFGNNSTDDPGSRFY